MSRQALAESDLAALPTPSGQALARVLNSIVREVHFDEVNRDLRLPHYGGDYDVRPFPMPASPVDTHEMKMRLRKAVKAFRGSDDALMARRIRHAFAFFMFGNALPVSALEELFGDRRRASLDEGLRLGLFVNADGQAIRMNGLSLFSRTLRNGEVIHLFADTPPHFDTRAIRQRVYAGADSYELMERVSDMPAISGHCVEMGSGSGVQMIAALSQHPAITRAIGTERDRRARSVSLFNAALNGVDQRMTVVADEEGLVQAMEGHPISFAMINPPFIAVPGWIDIDAEDRETLSTLMRTRDTERGVEGDLRSVFPESGWGGAAGLDVTMQFVDALVPLLAPEGLVVIYSQWAGDADGPRALYDYVRSKEGFRVEFEPVRSRQLAMKGADEGRVVEGESQRVLSARDAAISVARLIIAALMERTQPRQHRLNIRTNGPEHVLLMKFARRIEDAYYAQGFTHFHDGFAVLAMEQARSTGQYT
jgi:methylase of polypeptide subunit release factors